MWRPNQHPRDRSPVEVDEYLTWVRLERGRATTTVEAYRRDLRAWISYLDEVGKSILDADEDDILRWLEALNSTGLARSTVKRRVVAVRNLYRFLATEGIATSNPSADVVPPSVARGLPKALDEAEIDLLLDALVGDDPVARRDRAILETLYGTGMRISELASMSLRDVDLHDGYLRVIGKGDKERVVPILGTAAQALDAWIDVDGRGAMIPKRWRRRTDEEAVFLNQRGGRLGRQGIWLIVRAAGDEVGLGARLTPHVLRHSCATHLLDHGADIRVVQELLGHASIGTTQVYTKVSDERLVAVWKSAHPRA